MGQTETGTTSTGGTGSKDQIDTGVGWIIGTIVRMPHSACGSQTYVGQRNGPSTKANR